MSNPPAGPPTQAVIKALRDHLAHEQQKLHASADIENLVAEIRSIGRHFAALPIHDLHRLEEMLYDENGLPAPLRQRLR